jgi:hypothetical protein
MKRLKSILLSFTLLFSAFSCTKENEEKASFQNEIVNEPEMKTLYPFIVAYVILKLAEGQFEGTKTTEPNGAVKYNGKCKGLGACAMSGVVNEDDNNDPLSTLYDYEFDYEFEASLAVSDVNEVFLVLDNDLIEPDIYDKFIQNSQFTLSKVYTIDNSYILEQLGFSQPLTIDEGVYEANSIDGITYIKIFE